MRLTLIALLLAGIVGCDSEPVSEFDAARQSAEQGDANAQFNLGLMYRFGNGVPKDDVEAVKWFRKAAESYRKAAEQGDSKAQFNLGAIYANGEGLPEDYVEAYAWWSVAATNGNKLAKQDLTKAKAELTPEQFTAAEKRVEELLEQINANKVK